MICEYTVDSVNGTHLETFLLETWFKPTAKKVQNPTQFPTLSRLYWQRSRDTRTHWSRWPGVLAFPLAAHAERLGESGPVTVGGGGGTFGEVSRGTWGDVKKPGAEGHGFNGRATVF